MSNRLKKIRRQLAPLGSALLLLAALSGCTSEREQAIKVVQERLHIKPEHLEMDERSLRVHFKENKEEAKKISDACDTEKLSESEISVKVNQICSITKRVTFFKTHKERTPAFSSRGGNN